MNLFLELISDAVSKNSIAKLNEAILKLNDSNIWGDPRDILSEVSVVVDAFMRMGYTGEQIRHFTKNYRQPLPQHVDTYLKRNPKVGIDIRGMGFKFENGTYTAFF